MKKVLLVFLSLFATGCTTIHFDNGKVPVNPGGKEVELWHHIVALDLYELSKPVDLDKECGEKEWVTVKSEKSPVNAIAGSVANAFGPIWYPKTATVNCEK